MKQITITITVPDGVDFTPQVTTIAQNAPLAAVTSVGAPVCPKHGAEKVAPSQYGGFYCKAADDSTTKGYCSWKVK